MLPFSRAIDRYVIRQLTAPFLLFLLVLLGVFWLVQVLKIVEIALDAADSAQLLAEFAFYLIPISLAAILPVAGFIAAAITINRLYNDGESVVMMAIGLSPWSLLRPVFWFGAGVAMLTAVTTLWLKPAAHSAINLRKAEISQALSRSLLQAGQFMQPVDDVTIFIQKKLQGGALSGVFVEDARDPDNIRTYSASNAGLRQDGSTTHLVMFDGNLQNFNRDGASLSMLRFEKFSYDLSSLMPQQDSLAPSPQELPLASLIFSTEQSAQHYNSSLGRMRAKGHERLAVPLKGLIYPLIAAVTILAGRYRRRGFTLRIAAALLVGIFLDILTGVLNARIYSYPNQWPLWYLPTLLGLVYIFAVATIAQRPSRPRPTKKSTKTSG